MIKYFIGTAKLLKYFFLGVMVGFFASLSYANIDNPTPLIVLHGDSSLNAAHVAREQQPFEDNHFLKINFSTNSTELIKIDQFMAQLAQLHSAYVHNYALVAHSLGCVIMFEYLKSITTSFQTKPKFFIKQLSLLPKQAKSTP